MTFKTLLLFALSFLAGFVVAQKSPNALAGLPDSFSPWSGAVFLGRSNYWGDLAKGYPLVANSEPAFGAMLSYQVSPNFGIRGSLNYGKLKAMGLVAGRQASFKRTVSEVSLMFEYDFLGRRRYGGNTLKRTFSPYLVGGFLGIGYGAPHYFDELEDGSKVSLALPFGIGVRYDINSRCYLAVEHVSRLLFNGNMDGIILRGKNGSNNDIYNFGGIKIGFNFGSGDPDHDDFFGNDDECPTIAGTIKGCPDNDGDKIPDKDDACPQIAGKKRFDGCLDSDSDGIPDPVDRCPDAKGFRRLSGCPDSDFDLIIDLEDLCPTVVGIPAMQGCPDADRDQITDAKDKCPDEPGPQAFDGCPDSDKDGIPDAKDDCPYIPGLAAFFGCIDTDGDGLSDPKDKCPSLKGPANEGGCPKVEAADKAVLDRAMHQISFRNSSAELLPISKTYLAEIAEVVSRYPGFKLTIDGYTDNAGPVAIQQSLSEARARACYDYLSDLGVHLTSMKYAGHGPSSPISANNTEEGRSKNRRVEFTLKLQ
jgi:outer membrane protein OmpA-like peptidoglycan-associated protein